MISFLTLLTSLFLFATSVLAQGRPGVTRGQIFFGCYTARPTGSSTQPAPIQAANSASFAGCLVCFLFGYNSTISDDRPIVVPSLHLNCLGTGKHQPRHAGVDPYSNSLDLNKLQTRPVQLLNGHMGVSRPLLPHTEHRLVGHSPMLGLPLLPIPK